MADQYYLALKNRLEIPPLLLRRLIEDARAVLRLMIREIERDENGENEKRRQRIVERLEELENSHRLFVEHC